MVFKVVSGFKFQIQKNLKNYYLFIFLYIQNTTPKIITTTIITTIGRKMANELKVIAVPVSTVETIGFPNPAVFTEDAKRVVVVSPCMAVALPVPAIMAKMVVIVGDRSTKVDAITTKPATAAKGVAMVSNKLSINGI